MYMHVYVHCMLKIHVLAPLHMQHRNHILYLVEKFRTVILVGETGSGKTTQVRCHNICTCTCTRGVFARCHLTTEPVPTKIVYVDKHHCMFKGLYNYMYRMYLRENSTSILHCDF